MNAAGKMDLMKMSMIELVKILRPEDNVTILKYAAEVHIVLDHTSGDKKEEIISSIKGIKTSGSTAGGDAIKTAYAMNYEKYIQGGNNLVIIITDGLFNKGATDYAATIETNYKKYGTIFSVVGIKTTELVAQHMQGVVAKGGGDFIQINSIHDAQTKLIGEIRRTAYKG
jgi:Ca-activated chloride channel family protein